MGHGQIHHAQAPQVCRRVPRLPPGQCAWGQLAVAALLEEFGLAERLEREPALGPCTHRGKGYTPLAYVTQRLHCFTSGGVLLADAERLNEDEPFKALLGVEKLSEQTSINEWLRDMGQPGRPALRRLSRDFVQWALARAEPGRYQHLGRMECFFEDPQIEVSGRSFEGTRINDEGPRALSWQLLLVGPFLADPILAPPARSRKGHSGMGPVRM